MRTACRRHARAMRRVDFPEFGQWSGRLGGASTQTGAPCWGREGDSRNPDAVGIRRLNGTEERCSCVLSLKSKQGHREERMQAMLGCKLASRLHCEPCPPGHLGCTRQGNDVKAGAP